MASISVSRTVDASPAAVWDLIGGFDTLPDWLPFIPSSVPQHGGRARRLTSADGVSDAEVEDLFGGIYRDGLQALDATIAGREG